MKRRSSRQTYISLILTVLLVTASCAFAALAQTPVKKAAVQIGVGLDTKSTTQSQLASLIRTQLDSRNIAATDQEVQKVAKDALDLLNRSKDPQKGVIYIHTKKFTFCASWGADKTFCKSH
jgi:hypothetical protein